MTDKVEQRRIYPKDVRVELASDPFVEPEFSKYMLRFKMVHMVVDGIPYVNNYGFQGTMVSVRTEMSDILGAMIYQYDGFEMDEEHFLDTGCWRSKNPDYFTRHPNCGCDHPAYM